MSFLPALPHLPGTLQIGELGKLHPAACVRESHVPTHSEGDKLILEVFFRAGEASPGSPPQLPASPGVRGPAQPYPRSTQGRVGIVCLNGAKNIAELGRTVLRMKWSQCKLRVSVWRGRWVFAIFLSLRNPISDLPLQHFTCWLVPILQMPLCHRGNISPEIISMAIWRSLCKLHLAVACKIVCRNHLALTKS